MNMKVRKTLKSTVDTVRGPSNVRVRIGSNVRPADTAPERLRGITQLAKEQALQLAGDKNPRIKGDSGKTSQGQGLPRDSRQALASKESGPMAVYQSFSDPGFIQPPANISTNSLQNGVQFLETYRNDPTKGIVEKSNYPIASIQVLSRNQGKGRLASGSNVRTILPSYTRFMLQRADMPASEKYQLSQTFRSFRMFMFGAAPQIWSFSGTLLNTENHNWSSEFRSIYNSHLRGSRCAKLGAEVYLTFQDIAISGIMISTNSSMVSSDPNQMPFQFTIVVTNDAFISTSPIIEFAERVNYPLGRKSSPPLVFEIIKNIYSRKYGSKESRGGTMVMNQQRAAKSGQDSKEIGQSVTNQPLVRN